MGGYAFLYTVWMIQHLNKLSLCNRTTVSLHRTDTTSTYRTDMREQDLADPPGKITAVVEVLGVGLVEQQCTACSLESVRVCVRVFPCLCVFRVLSSPGPVRLQDYLITLAN